MATTLTNMNETLIVSQIIAALKNALIPVNAVSFGVDTVGRVKDDVLRVPVITDPSAQTKTPGTGLTSDGAAATTSVTLSTLKEAKWQLNEAEVNASRASQVFAALAQGAAYSLAKTVLDAICALVTNANFASKHTVPSGDFGQNDIGELFRLAEVAKLGRDRSMVLNAAYAAALFGNSNLALILATQGNNIITTGTLPPLLGMVNYVYSALPDNSENLGGFVADKTAIAAGIAPPEPLADAGEGNLTSSEIITDPESTVSALYKRWYDADAGTVYGSLSVLYGVSKVNASIVRIVSA